MTLSLHACGDDNVPDEPERPVERPDEEEPAQPVELTDTIRLMMVGNSFALNAADQFLCPMLDAEEREYVVSRIHVASCSVQMHAEYAAEGKAPYQYREMHSDGTVYNTKDISLKDVLERQKWTVVSFQQVSYLSGQYKSFAPYLAELMQYVDKYVLQPYHKVFYQTWAYEADYDGSRFAMYNNNQMTMYNAICSVSSRLMEEYKFAWISPCGTAIQNMRKLYPAKAMTFDGMHLDDLGQFVIASVWCECLTGNDARENKYTDSKFTDEEMRLAREAAHAAVVKPYSVSF